MKSSLIPILLILCYSCSPTSTTDQTTNKTKIVVAADTPLTEDPPRTVTDTLPPFTPFTRDSIVARLKAKITGGEPLVVHLFVPLCDNDRQGIVPVSRSLGDGLNLQTNLYWGARYGVRSFFKNRPDWRLLLTEPDPSENILERLTFFKTFPNGTKVFLVADAYRGDRMRACLTDYLGALAGDLVGEVVLPEGDTIRAGGQSDLLAFTGHNGLMDTTVDPVVRQDGDQRDATVIACLSHEYFREYLNYAGGYPLVMTRSLMAPEAYVIAGIIDAWAMLRTEEEIFLSAARAYDQYQHCGLRGAKTVFRTGW